MITLYVYNHGFSALRELATKDYGLTMHYKFTPVSILYLTGDEQSVLAFRKWTDEHFVLTTLHEWLPNDNSTPLSQEDLLQFLAEQQRKSDELAEKFKRD